MNTEDSNTPKRAREKTTLEYMKEVIVWEIEQINRCARINSLDFQKHTVILRDPDDDQNFIVVTNESKTDLREIFEKILNNCPVDET